jgi:cell wall-associated NlpC family hydrolase
MAAVERLSTNEICRRAALVAAAHAWLETPFRHQGRRRGEGVDCIGLIVGVAADCGIALEDHLDYPPRARGEALGAELRRQLLPARLILPGTVLWLRFGDFPTHVGLCTGGGIIHAYEPERRVIEHGLGGRWRRRLVGVFDLPGVV